MTQPRGWEDYMESKSTANAPLISDRDFEKIKNDSARIYAYANRVLNMANQWQESRTAGFALFDKNGCLLKLYGPEGFHAFCRERGVQARSRWDEGSWYPTAVSRGLAEQCEASSSGEENPPALRDAAIFFTPLMLEDSAKTGTYQTLGGIALISPLESAPSEPMLICSSLANDIVLHMFMAGELYDLYFLEPRGLLTLDINAVTGSVHLLYHNEQLFRTLKIPYENLYFKKAREFFDPLPKNKQFWDMVNNLRGRTDEVMPISVRGREELYSVTSVPYRQTQLHISGIRLSIATQRDISKHLGQQIGNNAIHSFSSILGRSQAMMRAIAKARSIARSDSNAMITGESGVGKDIFAQAIHNASHRRDKPFIVLNCAAYPRDLLASELFGYEGGAYTGAKKNGNLGKFELADGGTIFLDEIGDMPLDLQVMLLRVIEQKSFMRIGSNVERKVDVKLIAATNADLQSMIEKRTFRMDLYFRLSTLTLHLPPLRERGDDIILLAEHFLSSALAKANSARSKSFSPEARELLLRLPWTGNVRELQNVMERLVQLVSSDVITPEDVLLCLDFPPEELPDMAPAAPRQERRRREISREEILQALEACHYNRSRAADRLGISRKTFYRKLDELGIELS